ncbi:MAG: rhodanese-like domain-containing protein [Chloroflexi bacterium]|nr:rhodanese-like domain-containing protein [Chloroflexota bacterium]
MHAVETLMLADAAQMMTDPQAPLSIDVQEPWEYAYAHIEGAQLRPLGDLQQWLVEV